MATTTTTATTPLSISSSSTLIDTKTATASPQCVSLPTLPSPPVQSQSRVAKTAAYCRKFARNVVAMATTGEVTAELAVPQQMETADIVKTVQEAWEKVEDKYAVSSLAAAGVVFLCGSVGAISAIDKLPLIPNALELVGIGYTGWFAYKNLIFKPDREALVNKIKDTYKEIIG